MLKDREVLLLKDHPQRMANREDNEQHCKRKKDEAEKRSKHADRKARNDAGEDIDTTDEDDGEDIEDLGSILPIFLNLEKRSYALLFARSFLADDPYALFFGGGPSASQPDVGAVGTSQGPELWSLRRSSLETFVSHDPSGGVEIARVEPSGGVATPLTAGIEDAPLLEGEHAPSPPVGPIATSAMQTTPVALFGPVP